MEQKLKQRLTGAAVLVILAVIFIPMFLDTAKEGQQGMDETNIPVQPPDIPVPPEEDFSSRIVPLLQLPEQTPAEETESALPPPAVEVTAPSDSTVSESKTPQPEVLSEDQADRVGVSAWVVQLGSFTSKDNAEVLNQKLRQAGFKSFVEPLNQDGETSYRVRVGPELKRSDADGINELLKTTMQMEGIVVHYP
ncbi:MAG: SPOR domain-containing protein [Gammaproteobacteria bacterium]